MYELFIDLKKGLRFHKKSLYDILIKFGVTKKLDKLISIRLDVTQCILRI